MPSSKRQKKSHARIITSNTQSPLDPPAASPSEICIAIEAPNPSIDLSEQSPPECCESDPTQPVPPKDLSTQDHSIDFAPAPASSWAILCISCSRLARIIHPPEPGPSSYTDAPYTNPRLSLGLKESNRDTFFPTTCFSCEERRKLLYIQMERVREAADETMQCPGLISRKMLVGSTAYTLAGGAWGARFGNDGETEKVVVRRRDWWNAVLRSSHIRIEYFGLVEPVGEAPYFGRNDKVVQHSFFGFMCMRGSSSSSRFR